MTLEKYFESVFSGSENVPKTSLHASLGLASEVGEVCDLLKKQYFESSLPLAKEAFISEMGDVLFYWCALMHLNGVSLDAPMKAQIKKRQERGF